VIEGINLLKESNMAVKKAAAKKTVAKKAPAKTVAKKSVAKTTDAPAATRVDDRAPDSAPIPSTQPVVAIDDSVVKVAAQVLRGSRRWGTGRERDIRLAKAGYDVDAVRREVQRQRHAQSVG
jgi:CW_7 repeat